MASSSAKKWMVIGLGGTGLSVVRWLAANGEVATLVDDRADFDAADVLAVMPAATVANGATSDVSLDGIDCVVASPGISPRHELIKRAMDAGVEVISDIELFCRSAAQPIVAVTGSNGKSTVVSLLKDMCDAARVSALAGANLGVPALELLTDEPDVTYLLELSSFQLERTRSLNAIAAVVLNVSEDHIDWHGNIEHYRDAKLRIYDDCEFAVINADDLSLQPQQGQPVRVEFTLREPTSRQFGVATIDGERCLMFGSEKLVQISNCALRGTHNVANMLAALALGSAIDLPLSAMRESLKRFNGLRHRHQHIGDYDGVHWINDSKATNIGASLASVAAVSGPVILLLGGRAKGESFEALAKALPAHVRQCIIYGENRDTLALVLEQAGHHFQSVLSLDDAVTVAAKQATRGDTVLLAPAAASQDAFDNYAARGDRFVELVRERCA
ncbi:MAG: UDP-N-acetylmuramoyl-L-alanine--D-glutamate ligase [Woeseiaceae bacterium]